MYPVLPFGPMTIPTAPLVTLVAVVLGLEIAGRYGKRFGLTIDDVWNIGLLTILAGLIVARLWNVIQFWPIYAAEPWLILSIRPSGFATWPGIFAGLVMAFGYMVRHALNPMAIVLSHAVGITVSAAVMQMGMLLTGDLLGLPTDLPWAVAYYGELRHPVAVYYAIGLLLAVVLLWYATPLTSPVHLLAFLLLTISIVYLFFGAFEDNAISFGSLRSKQVGALCLALCATFVLARSATFNVDEEP